MKFIINRAKPLELVKANYPVIKHGVDIVVAAIFLVALIPVLICISILVKLTSSGPVLFWSDRRGLNGETFSMPKFRTMTTCSSVMSREIALDGDICITWIGKILRKTSLDELPQLWSVLKGDMSLVGPRPLILNDYAAGYRLKHPIIFTVKPGITGLAQVNGRSFVSPSKKARYDTFYASRVCMLLDMKILFKTVSTVFDFKAVK